MRISLADNIKVTPICTYIWFFFAAVWLFFCMSVLYFLKARRVMLEPKGSLIVRRLAPNAVLARQLPNQWTWLDESIVQFFITHLKLCEKWEKSLPASNIAQWDEIWRKSIAYVIFFGIFSKRVVWLEEYRLIQYCFKCTSSCILFHYLLHYFLLKKFIAHFVFDVVEQ